MPAGGSIQVLVTRVDDATHRRIADTLRQIRVDLHRVRWDETTLELVQGTPFDVVIIGYPVSREALNRFLDAARTKGAAGRRPARVQLFADGRPLRLMAQVDNVSTSGMLLRGVTQFPVGTTFGFEMVVP